MVNTRSPTVAFQAVEAGVLCNPVCKLRLRRSSISSLQCKTVLGAKLLQLGHDAVGDGGNA